jgi:tetratricopeptide (TPR) repeat protein
MKTAVVVASAVLLSCAASYVLCSSVSNARDAAPVKDDSAAAIAALADDVRELRASGGGLRGEIDALRSELATRPSGEARVPLADIEAAVERALASRAPAAGSATAADESSARAAAPKKRTPKQALEAILAVGKDWDAMSALWAELRDAGMVDEVLALFEERAKSNPKDAAVQVELGQAYLQKLFTVPNGPEQGTWAIKADQAFDSALAIDDHHWGARFNKAISLSNWPAFLGKQNEAARHFETLLEQQKASGPREEHAETYFFLGNLYQSMGKTEQALATWNAGLAMFPDHDELKGQVASATGH